MDDNALKKLAKELSDVAPGTKKGKSNRTLSLTEPDFTILQRYCRNKGLKVSQVVDRLIALFLDEIKDDLAMDDIPPDE